MAPTERIFFAGVGTTFAILAAGFGGGLMMANSALKEPSSYQARASQEALTPVRVILPRSAEAAQPPSAPIQQPEAEVAPTEPLKEVQVQAQAPVEKQRVQKDKRKEEAEERARRRRYAERKARREARARQLQEQARSEQAPIMAFDERPSGLFGN